MNEVAWIILAIFVLSLITLVGFMQTKKTGWGPFNTSTLLVTLVLLIASLLYAGGKLSEQVIANVFFATVGFAGGLFTKEKSAN